jgi:putative transposase
MPTPKTLWSHAGHQATIPTPARPAKRPGIGAVDSHTGEAVFFIRRRKRRREAAERLEALPEKHPVGAVAGTRDDATPHEDEDIAAGRRATAGRRALRYRPASGPWSYPIEMLRRPLGRGETPGDRFSRSTAPIAA